MGKELPLAECAFGWGRVFRLYSDYLEVNGIPYALSALTRVRPTFRIVMGVPSARLELWFGRKKVVLRGLSSFDDARAVQEYLSSWCRQEFSLDSQEQPTWPGSTLQQKRGRKRPGESLPTIPVPVRLLSGEEAYYSVMATLCGEPIGEDSRVTYPARDQGTLILTNRRMIYIGRTSQVVIDYAHLLRTSRLHGAIAIQTDFRSRREIFELREPEECAQYLGTILARARGTTYDTAPGNSIRATFRVARGNSAAHWRTSNAEEFVPEPEGWAAGEVTAGHSNETSLDDEIETDALTRRNWQMERMRLRLRDTDDFQERWQEQRTGTPVVEAVESAAYVGSAGSTGEVGSAEDVEAVKSTADMMPDSVADALSQEVGGNE